MFTDDLCCSQYETSGLLIPVQVFGTGLSIAHSGTIVVMGSAQGGELSYPYPQGISAHKRNRGVWLHTGVIMVTGGLVHTLVIVKSQIRVLSAPMLS